MRGFAAYVVVFILSLGGIDVSANPITIIAHRGASYAAPENTMASFELGWNWADGIELDIQRSKDGRAMVIHDADTARVSDKDYSIPSTDSAVLRTVDVGSHKDKKFAGEKIPFVEEVLAAQPKDRIIFIEIKCGQDVLPVLCDAIKSSGKQDIVHIIGFDIDVITAFKKIIPTIPVYWLCSKPQYDSAAIIKLVKEHCLDGVDLGFKAVDKPLVDAIRSAGLKTYVWTVDNPLEMKRMIDAGVNGITTNRPDVANNVLRHYKTQ
ncbi:glycerophosphodiester phosphodiesterase [bacterium]|nr:glycerophosphodiester phosphodiesterase [bacterium]